MTVADDVRQMIADVGVRVTYTQRGGVPVPDVPVLLLDHSGSAAEPAPRKARMALLRVSKAEVPTLGYRDTVTEADGTVWTVYDAATIVNDRNAGTWRATVSTAEKGKF